MPQIDPKQIKQAGATTSQVLTFDGTKWAPADAAGGGGGAVDPSVIPSNQEWPTASSLDDATAFSISITQAMYIPFHINAAQTIKNIAILPKNQSGNVDVGIYELDGTRLVSAGSTAMGLANRIQIFDISDTVLTAGRYYMAIVFSTSASDRMWQWTQKDEANAAKIINRLLIGMRQELSALPLPATATFAVPGDNQVGGLSVMSLLLEA